MSALCLGAACSQSGVPAQARAGGYQPVPPALRGGTAVIADYEYPSTLNPLAATTDLELRLGRLSFVPLWGLDDNLRPYPELVRAVPTLSNGAVKVAAGGRAMSVDVRLASGLRWSDGRQLTSDDVIFTWRALTDPSSGLLAPTGLAHLTGMTRRSPTELTWTFDSVFAPYLELGAGLYVMPEHRLSDVPHGAWAKVAFFQKPDVVSGPFRPDQVAPPERIRFVANPAYRGGGGSSHGPWLDGVTLSVAPSKQAMVSDLRSGAADLGWHLDASDVRGLGSGQGLDVRAGSGLRTELLRPNPDPGRSSAWAADPTLLEALALAVDRTALVNLVPEGAGLPARGVFPRALGPGFAAGSPLPGRADLARAQRLLDGDGWTPGPDGVRNKAGRRLAFDIVSLCGDMAVSTAVAGRWAQAGAEARVGCQPRGAFLAQLSGGAYDMALYSDEPGADPADWALPGCAEQGFAKGATTLDQRQREAAYQAAEREWIRRTCTIPLVEPNSFRLVSRRLRNVAPSAGPGGDTWNAADWWLSAD